MILIDMALPTSCGECPCCQPDVHRLSYTCGIVDEDIRDYETRDLLEKRPEWCPMKKVPGEDKTLSYEEFISLAKKNYARGGDSVVECWGKRDFEEYEELFGPMTKASAMEMFQTYESRCNEHRAMADWGL